MAVDVVTNIVIDAPIERVAAYVADPSNATEWYVNIREAVWKTEPPIAIGSQIEFVARFMGKRLAYTYEVIEYEPQKKMVMSTAQGPFPMETTYEWEAVGGDQTKVTLRNRGQPAGFSRIMAPLMAIAMRRANRKDLRLLKRLMES